MIKHTRVRVLPGADAATFEYLDHHYARDARSVYHAGERFEVADPASFEPLGYGHARDRVRGCYARTPIAGSDGSTFSAVDDHYSKDARQVYYSTVEVNGGVGPAVIRSVTIRGADPATFTIVDGSPMADPAGTDSAATSPDATDARASYRKGERVGDPRSAARP